MATKSNIGKTLYVAAALPATNDAEGFEALTWVKVNGVVQGPQFGITHANIDVPDLETGFTSGVKGSGSGQDSQMQFRIDRDVVDEGRDLILTEAQSAQGQVSLRLVRGTGVNNAPVVGDEVQYAQGYLHSYVENQATTDSYEGFSVNFKQNAPTVIDELPVV